MPELMEEKAYFSVHSHCRKHTEQPAVVCSPVCWCVVMQEGFGAIKDTLSDWLWEHSDLVAFCWAIFQETL